MEPFTLALTAGYIGNLGAALSHNILSEAGRGIRRAISGDDMERAFNRCVQAGVVAVAQSTASQEPERTELLKDILDRFFREPDVGGELSEILNGREPDYGELARLFEDAGYDPETLSGVEFDLAINAFAAAFLSAATLESQLQPVIQTKQLLEQTHIQRELLDTMKKLAAFLKESKPDTIGIQAGSIIAENVVSGQQHCFPSESEWASGARNISVDGGQTGVIGDHVHVEGGIHFHSAIGQENDRPSAAREDSEIRQAELERFYLNGLIHRCDSLELASIEDSCFGGTDDARTVVVSDVFTTLYIKNLARWPDESVEKAIKRSIKRRTVEGDEILMHGMDFLEKGRAHEEKQTPIQATEAAAVIQHLVLLGQPGGGKSTLVNHMATELARWRMADPKARELPGWEEEKPPLPVRIILRQFAAWLNAARREDPAGLVWEYLRHQFEEWECADYFDSAKRILTGDGGVIFFDGLDEVIETDEEKKRDRILAAVQAFSKTLPQCRVLVTCREYAYRREGGWRLPESEFLVMEIDLFHKEQIETFIHSWYRATGTNKGWPTEKSQQEAIALFSAIQAMPHLQELAPSPLLLTLMAIVHGSKGLPQDRVDLYERAVELLLAHWENRIVRTGSGGCKVEPSIIMRLGLKVHALWEPLEQTALDAHESQEGESNRAGCADIPREDLREKLAAKLGGSLDKAEAVIDYIQNRAGLLQAKDNRTFAFPHRTFQEYLTATGVMRRSDFDDFLSKRVVRDISWWREVFLLAAGASRSTPRNICYLVDSLVPDEVRDIKPSPEMIQYARLSAQAMAETDFLRHVASELPPGRYAKTHKRIQNWLLAGMGANDVLGALERCAAGDALNWIDDPRFNPDLYHLPDDEYLGFIEISGGEFLMGSDEGRDQKARDAEFPQHRLDLPVFWINRYPVTVAQFRAFFDASEKRPRYQGSLRGFGNHPVVLVSWFEAMAYCKWVTKALREHAHTPESIASLLRQGWRMTLPSEAQWEKAARGSDGRIYPWGDTADPNNANYIMTGIGGTSPVGCFPGGANPAIMDMIGNVLEWTCSAVDDYPYRPEDGREDEASDAGRVLRGGSWDLSAAVCRAAFRAGTVPGNRNGSFGFRLALRPSRQERRQGA